jgi:hypothetical protein
MTKIISKSQLFSSTSSKKNQIWRRKHYINKKKTMVEANMM